MTTLFALLFAYQVKHFLADFALQTRWMLGKFRADWSFFWPLAAHAGVHGALTLAICLVVDPELWWLCLVDGVSHFILDRIKAGPRWLGRFDDKNDWPFWWAIGSDQMAHHLVHYLCIYMLVC